MTLAAWTSGPPGLFEKGGKCSFSALSLEKGGKPVIADEKHFFLTFPTVGLVPPSAAYGVSPSEVSISRKETPDRFHIAERCFAEGEQALIREQGPEMFTRIWAREESYFENYRGRASAFP